MRSIGKLFAAFGTLADSVLSLASVIDVATGKLKMQLAQETDPPALAHGGEVIENATVEAPSTKRSGRKTAA